MSLVKYSNPIPGIFDQFFENDLFDWSNKNYSETNTTLPSVNIKEDENAFEVEMSAPGFNKKEFKIELNNETLTISSEKKIENEERDGKKIRRKEFSYQSFQRSFTLPQSADADKISANYENGILSVNIPKREEAKPKPSKLIQIK